jgi:hypothetical protein
MQGNVTGSLVSMRSGKNSITASSYIQDDGGKRGKSETRGVTVVPLPLKPLKNEVMIVEEILYPKKSSRTLEKQRKRPQPMD